MMALLHLFIAIVMNEFILQFSLVMLVSYTLFLDSEVIKKVLSKIKKRYNLISQRLIIPN